MMRPHARLPYFREATLSLLQTIMGGVRQAFIEQRRSLREDVRFPAWIDVGGGELRECTVLDVSDEGARIAIQAPHQLPVVFYMVLSRNGTRRPCRLIWRSKDEAGLFYLGPLNRVSPGILA